MMRSELSLCILDMCCDPGGGDLLVEVMVTWFETSNLLSRLKLTHTHHTTEKEMEEREIMLDLNALVF